MTSVPANATLCAGPGPHRGPGESMSAERACPRCDGLGWYIEEGLFDDAAYERIEPTILPVPDPRSVVCPYCRAMIGRPCKRPSGHAVFGGGVHAQRSEAALTANAPEGSSEA